MSMTISGFQGYSDLLKNVNMRDAALDYVRHGYKVFPLWWPLASGVCACPAGEACGKNSGKHPLAPAAPHGFNDASSDPVVVSGWWTKYPYANIGLPTGDENKKLYILDSDPRNNGGKLLHEQVTTPLPDTPSVSTGGDGFHLYCEGNDTLPKRSKIAGLDVKYNGGYVAAPPSLHHFGKRYEFSTPLFDHPLACVPSGLVEEIRPEAQTAVHREHTPNYAANGFKRPPEYWVNWAVNKMLPQEGGLRRAAFVQLAMQLRDNHNDDRNLCYQMAKAYCDRVTRLKDHPFDIDEAEPILDSILDKTKPRPAVVIGVNLSDVGNAELFVSQHGHDVKYSPNGWLVFNGKRWVRDEGLQAITERAIGTVRSIASLDLVGEGDFKAKAKKHVARSQDYQRINGMLKLAQRLLYTPAEKFDANPLLFNIDNGTVDLQYGTVYPHRRDDLMTRLAPITYDPVSPEDCPNWKEYERIAFQGNAELIRLVREAVGYAMTGLTTAQCFFLLLGDGGTGKSTLTDTCLGMFGDYAWQAPMSTFLQRKGNQQTNDLARLNGVRFVKGWEIAADKELDEAVIKQITGDRTITARFLNKENISFRPVCKLFLPSNNQPKLTPDNAMFRRVKVIPFNVRILEHAKRDKMTVDFVDHVLKSEWNGIFHLFVLGCVSFLKRENGFDGVCEMVATATEEYRMLVDPLGRFKVECLHYNPSATTSARVLYETYSGWCEAQGELAVSKKAFGMALRRMGLESTYDSGKYVVYKGVEIKE